MEERLSALFEFKLEKVQQEMRGEMDKQTVESEKQRVEMEKLSVEMEKQKGGIEMQRVENESLRSIVTRVESDNTHLLSSVLQLKLDNARLLTDLTEVHNDLRILHPLHYARLHLQKCINHQIACNDAVNAFISLHTLPVICSTPCLTLHLQELNTDLKKAWDARFAAAFLCEPPPTLESLLWIVAKSGYTKEVAPFMNLSTSTRECKNLRRVMREVRIWVMYGEDRGRTQLFYFCSKGMTSSVMRMLEMKSIDVEARTGGREDGWTCLMAAARYGHLDICCLLIDKGAQIKASGGGGMTPLHSAVYQGHIEFVRLLCDRGADIEARCNGGWWPLQISAYKGHISIVKELIEVRNADINARINDGRTVLRLAQVHGKADIAAYLISRGGIE
jgi:hypothetical protein